MNVRLESEPDAVLVIPEGRLDFGAAAGFQAELERALAAAARRALIIDCGALEYVSSAGLRVFLLAARDAGKSGLAFAVCGLLPAVRDVFEVSGFARLIPAHADRAAALARIREAKA